MFLDHYRWWCGDCGVTGESGDPLDLLTHYPGELYKTGDVN